MEEIMANRNNVVQAQAPCRPVARRARHAQLAIVLAFAAGACNSRPSSPTKPEASTSARPSADDPPEAIEARERLVRRIAAELGNLDARVVEALRAVPRHRFYAAPSIEDAYDDRPKPIGLEQTISQPTVVAMMTQALALTGTERVLEIGTGSGYQAAILSRLAKHVDSIEILRPLGEAARDRLAAMSYTNVSVRIGDGYQGWPEEAPFDRILLTAAPPAIPPALLLQLAEGGILVAPVGAGRDQRLVKIRKAQGKWVEEDLG